MTITNDITAVIPALAIGSAARPRLRRRNAALLAHAAVRLAIAGTLALLILASTAVHAAPAPLPATWVLSSASELRPAAPPDARATRRELEVLRAMPRDPAALPAMRAWTAGAPSYRWVELALETIGKKPFTNPRNSRLLAMLNVAVND
jgi:hypothetical protein